MTAEAKKVLEVPVILDDRQVDILTLDPNGPTTTAISGWAEKNSQPEVKPRADDVPELTDLSQL